MPIKNDRPVSSPPPPLATIAPKSPTPVKATPNAVSAKGAAPSSPTTPNAPLVPNSKGIGSFSALQGGTQTPKLDTASIRSDYKVPGRGDLQYDGVMVGEGGQTFDPKKPLGEIKGVKPQGGVKSQERLLFVNGINTTLESQVKGLQSAANATGSEVLGVHNATGGMITDLSQCVKDKLDKGSNPPVDTLTNNILTEMKAGRDVHLLAHSQGALVTGRALKHVSETLRMEGLDGKPMSAEAAEKLMGGKLKVETFGGAEARFVDGPKYIHYVNEKDLVPTKFGQGDGRHIDELFRYPGKNASVVRFHDHGQNPLNPIDAHSFDEVYLKHRGPSFDTVFADPKNKSV